MQAALSFVLAHLMFVGAAALTLVVFIVTLRQSLAAHRRLRERPKVPFKADDEQRRFWEHAMHEDRQYNERLYFFLVFESVLLGVVGALFTRSGPPTHDLILRVLASLGLVVTLMWTNIQVHQKFYLETFYPRLAYFKEFEESATLDRLWRPNSRRRLLSYGVPLAVSLVWLTLIALLDGIFTLSSF